VKECNQCGKCCKNYSDGGLSASKDDIKFWEIFRPEIYRFVSEEKIWIDPGTGKQIKRCPWLRQLPNQEKYICDIYNDRPEDCKHYPVTINQMVRDECEMLEAHDLDNPTRSQSILDTLMADSRPPVE